MSTPPDELARAQAAVRQRERIEAYAVVFGSPAGQLVREDLREHLDGLSYTKGDPMHMCFLEGHRAALMFIENRYALSIDPARLETLFRGEMDGNG